MAQQYSIVCMCHIFFMRSSVDGHLGRFHVLATINGAAMNTGACVHKDKILQEYSYHRASRI